jgi:hypothetical protein
MTITGKIIRLKLRISLQRTTARQLVSSWGQLSFIEETLPGQGSKYFEKPLTGLFEYTSLNKS